MILDTFNLEGNVVRITGCHSGLGQAHAGCDIIGLNRSLPSVTADKITAIGGRFISITADLSDSRCVKSVMEQVLAPSQVNILVNNAGIVRRADALDFSEKDWDDVMNVNNTLFFHSQAVALSLSTRLRAVTLSISRQCSLTRGSAAILYGI